MSNCPDYTVVSQNAIISVGRKKNIIITRFKLEYYYLNRIGGKIFLFFLSSRVERSFENDRAQEKEEEEEKEIRGSVTRATLAGSIL